MKVKKCRTCGKEHWGPICPEFIVSDGGGRSKPTSSGVEVRRHSGRPSQPVERIPAGVFRASQVGVAPDPSEAISGEAIAGETANLTSSLSTVPPEIKRRQKAANGTFDKVAYQRKYMREWRVKPT